jgi:dihydrolipoamide dehydrogenase
MNTHDVIVIGGGPGGYVAAIRAAQHGLDAACIDENNQLGGTCLRVGCIPSKAMLESSEKFVETQHELAEHGVKVSGKVELDLAAMLARKERIVATNSSGITSLFKKNKVTHYKGRGRIESPGKVTVVGPDAELELKAKHIIIATGSSAATLKGIELDGDRIGANTEALSYSEVPGHLVVIGGGYIGLELGSVWHRLGAKVTVLEYLDRILPGLDEEIAAEARKQLTKQGIEFKLGVKVTGAKYDEKSKQCVVTAEGLEAITCDRVLMAVGRRPNTNGLNLEAAGVERDPRGFVVVDEQYRTNVEGIYGIGDVIGGAMLAHKAEEEGVACVDLIATGYGHVDYDSIPAVVFIHPEVAMVGQTEEQLREGGVKFKKGTFSFRANGRARTLGQTEGKVKVLADAQTDRVLGVHIIGPRAGDLIAEAAVAMAFGASAEDIAHASHAHPTLAEAIKEAAMAVDGRAIHS